MGRLGWDGDDHESTGKFTDVNIFSTGLQRMQEMTMTGTGLGFADGLLVTLFHQCLVIIENHCYCTQQSVQNIW